MPEIPSVTHDILNCLANLSNDEVFTPPELANKMIDLLPSALFDSTQTTFLDPCCKSGVFLREIAKRLINSKAHKATFETTLPQNLSEEEKHQKRLDHIYHKQLYGIAITQLTALMSRRTLYCSKYPNTDYSISKFDDLAGNIRFVPIDHRWDKNGKCKYCGASQVNYSQEARGENRETHAYEFIHTDKPEELWGKMKFDVIIGNPPYQMSDGGLGGSATPIYNEFILNSEKLNPRYLCMIIPARWYSGGRGLDTFRNIMLNDKRITHLIDYPISNECFPGVEIKGGVCYFLWKRDANDDCLITTIRNGESKSLKRPLLEEKTDTFIRYHEMKQIYQKIKDQNEQSFDILVSSSKPFGFRTYIKERQLMNKESDLLLYGNKSVGYIDKKDVTINQKWINQWKVFISCAYGAGEDFPHQILNKPFIGEPGSVCTETYLMIGPCQSKKQAENIISYIKTKFFRTMVLIVKNTQHAVKSVYKHVPLQDFSKPWTDAELYEKYGLSQEEIDFIESTIKPMA
jgi:site-specific DNA-methyltransferase (adenine-specific)